MLRREIFRLTGSPEQIMGIKDYRFIGGKADNMRAIDMYNQNGLSLTLLPDRGMDIGALSFRGINISFLSKGGYTAPEYFIEDGNRGFYDTFYVGFLMTCGLSHMGSSCNDNGANLGVHGPIANQPASEVCPRVEWTEQGADIIVSGRVKQARMFGEHLEMHRTIKLSNDKNKFTIEDYITNLAFEPSPYMILYHLNYGYPLLSEHTEIALPSVSVRPREESSISGLSSWMNFIQPEDDYKEQVFFHELVPDENGNFSYMVINNKLELAVLVTYPASQLPCFTEWKSMKSGEYVLGMEPGTNDVNGRSEARKNGTLQYLAGGETRHIVLTVEILTEKEKIEEARKRIMKTGKK